MRQRLMTATRAPTTRNMPKPVTDAVSRARGGGKKWWALVIRTTDPRRVKAMLYH